MSSKTKKSDVLLSIKGLKIQGFSDEKWHDIINGIDLTLHTGEVLGLIGESGAGKSTLLRIMAGVDTEYLGEARPQANLNVGYLPQEPELDNSKDVRGNIEDGLGEINELLKEFNAISDRFAEPMLDDEMTRLLDKQGDLQLKIDSLDGWNLERRMDIACSVSFTHLTLPPNRKVLISWVPVSFTKKNH